VRYSAISAATVLRTAPWPPAREGVPGKASSPGERECIARRPTETLGPLSTTFCRGFIADSSPTVRVLCGQTAERPYGGTACHRKLTGVYERGLRQRLAREASRAERSDLGSRDSGDPRRAPRHRHGGGCESRSSRLRDSGNCRSDLLTSVDRPSDGAGWRSLPVAVHDLTGLIEEGRGFRLLGWSLWLGVESLACDLSVYTRQRIDVPSKEESE
jgi:hypothetical protein